MRLLTSLDVIFFFNDTATTEIYTLSLHDALPICRVNYRLVSIRTPKRLEPAGCMKHRGPWVSLDKLRPARIRSEEHTSELQSLAYLVCRLLLEKKKKDAKVRRE